jgi:hypothetical protein
MDGWLADSGLTEMVTCWRFHQSSPYAKEVIRLHVELSFFLFMALLAIVQRSTFNYSIPRGAKNIPFHVAVQEYKEYNEYEYCKTEK